MFVLNVFLSKGKGFLLIELLVALAILSGLTLVVSSQIWQSIKLHKEAELRLSALNCAVSLLDQIAKQKQITSMSKTTQDGISVVVDKANVAIDQKKIDQIVFPAGQKYEEKGEPFWLFEFVQLTVRWKNLSQKKESMRFLTGLLLDGRST